MNKNKLLYLKKKLLVYGTMLTMIPTIYGCDLNRDEAKEFFSNEKIEDINLNNEKKYVAIKILDENGIENTYLTFKSTMLDLKSNNLKLDYPYIKDYDNDNNIIYFDILSKEIIAVKYIIHTNSINYEKYDKNVIEEKSAISLVTNHIGKKDEYTKEELENLLIDVNYSLKK